VLKDDPELTVRLVKGRNPARVILDSHLRMPLDARVLTAQATARTFVAATPAAAKSRLAALHKMGIEVLSLPPDASGRVDIKELLKTLASRQVSSVLVEGGAAVITSFLRSGLFDKVIAIIAPKIMGAGTAAVGELNISEVSQALKLTFKRVYRSGVDIVVEGSIINKNSM
jgi:riboflavin-specific deaminase-like protein